MRTDQSAVKQSGLGRLTLQEELDLGREMRDPARSDCQRLEARGRLIRCDMRMVRPLALRYRHRRLALDEAIAAGNYGLVRATATYDPGRGVRFSTYAHSWVIAEIRDAYRLKAHLVHIPVPVQSGMARWLMTEEELIVRYAHKPSSPDVDAACSLSGDLAIAVHFCLLAFDCASGLVDVAFENSCDSDVVHDAAAIWRRY